METVRDKRLEKALLFITKHFEHPISTHKMADAAGMSLFHFHRLFLDQTGETPGRYLLRLRMEHATHLIRLYPDKPLTEIALLSGYSTPAEFSRVFRKYFGYTARDFKKSGPSPEKNSIDTSDTTFPVFFVRKQMLTVYPSNLTDQGLENVFHHYRNDHPEGGEVIAVMVDPPFHTTLDKCRFYLGHVKEKQKGNLQYELAEGYYTCLPLTGDFTTVMQKLIYFKSTQLDPSPYEIASVTAFEKLHIPPRAAGEFNYFESDRQLFIKLRRK